MQDIFTTLEERGFMGQLTDPALRDLCAQGMVTFYIGFDPTADSLHIGSLKQIMMMAQFQRHGHRPIPVVGGGTGMIGDPSGKKQERKLLSREDIQKNLEGIRGQLAHFMDFSPNLPNATIILNNFDWLGQFSFIDFLRDVGKHFRVGEMLGKESVRVRIQSEEGMSFTEFCYQLLQAYDFLYLNDHYNCVLQCGGSDQWGNITAGIELIRKLRGKPAYGLTTPLVVTATGQKFGKTEAGTIWLSAERTSPFEFYQYWVRTDDRDVIPFLKIFTFLPLEEINEIERRMKEDPSKREAQKILAKEVSALVHGVSISTITETVSGALYGDQPIDPNVLLSDGTINQEEYFKYIDAVRVKKALIENGMPVVDLLVTSGLLKSKNEARRGIQGGGVSINEVKVSSIDQKVCKADLQSDIMLKINFGRKTKVIIFED